MPRYQKREFTYSDPGTGANTAQRFDGGAANFLMAFSAAATTTIIKAEISVDNGVTFVDLEDINGAAVSVTSAVAFDAYFNLQLPACLFRTNITAAGGATTTGTAWLVPSKDKTDG